MTHVSTRSRPYAMLCLLCYAILRYAMLCYAMLAMLCYTTLCYAMRKAVVPDEAPWSLPHGANLA